MSLDFKWRGRNASTLRLSAFQVPRPSADLAGGGRVFSWCILSVGLAAMFVAIGLVVVILGPDVYSGVDGKFSQDLITTYLSFERPFVVNTMNPLEGVFSHLFPLNIWLNPGFVQFLIFDHQTAVVVSAAVFLLVYCVATYCLARTVGLPLGAAVVSAQLGAFAFPPLYHEAGLFSNYDLMPGAAVTVALFTVLLCVVLRLQEVTWKSFALGAGLATTLIGYIVLNDPLTMGVIGFSFVVPFGVAVFWERRPAVIALRLLVLAAAAAIFYALGLVDYVLAMDHYTARFYFRDEFFRPQTTDFVSALYDFPEAVRTYGFLVPGWVLGLTLCRGRQRLVVWMAVLNFLWILVYGAVYLFSSLSWFAPLPIYLEEYAIHVAAIGAVAGWAALLRRLLPVPAGRVAALAAALMLPVLVAIYAVEIPGWMRGHYHEPWVDEPDLVAYLGDKIGLRDGAEYRGTAYVVMLGYRDQQTYVNLWRHAIPTLNEYSQTLTPTYHYFRTRLLQHTRADSEHMTGLFSPQSQFIIDRLDARAFAAVGTRFLLSIDGPSDLARHYGELGAEWRGTFSGKNADQPGLDRTWYVYELPDPNHGQYSPTVVRVAQLAPALLDAMRQPDFDWHREVLLNEPPAEQLRSARNVQMTVQRGTVRVRAETDGTAMLLLPVQYSHCLSLTGSRTGRLVRADFLLTGLVFNGSIDATIDLDFGFFRSSCRKADFNDLAALQMAPDVSSRPAGAQHPFAISSLGELPARIREALGRLKFLSTGR